MTNEKLIGDVRILELEVQKIELENRLAQLKAEPIIDEGCVGCCKVVDVAAKLQEELEDTEIKLVGCRKLIDDRDHTIRELSAMVEAKTKANQAIIHDKNTIIDEKDKMLEKQVHEISGMWGKVNALEAELSARKEDSAVLIKVVEIVKNWEDDMHWDRTVMKQIATIIKDYHDAPEGPPETPIDESNVLKKIRALVDDWSVNKKGGHQSFFVLSEINDMLKSTQHIDEKQEITVTLAYLELP